MQCPVNQYDIERAVRRVGRNIGYNTLNRQVFLRSYVLEIADSVCRDIHSDNTMSHICDENRIPTLSTSDIQDTNVLLIKLVKEIDENRSWFPQRVTGLTIEFIVVISHEISVSRSIIK